MSGVIASISSSSKLLTILSKDNRIHLWDTESRRERVYVEKNHLGHKYTCYDWRQKSSDHLGYFAVGCSDGVVVVWDFARGIVVNTIAHSSDAITAVAFSNDLSVIYVTNKQNYITQYKCGEPEVQNSIKMGKRKIYSIAMNPQIDVLAVASSSVKLVDMQSGRKKKLDMKFSGEITSMAFSQCGCYLAVCVADNQEIFLFDIQANASSSSALCTIPIIGVPRGIALRSTKQHVDILSWFEISNGFIARYSLNDSDGGVNGANNGFQNGHHTSHIQSTSLHTDGSILSGCFGTPGTVAASGVTLVTGLISSPDWKYLEYESEDSLLSEVTVDSTVVASSSSTKRSGDDEISTPIDAPSTTILGPFQSSGKKRPLILSNNDSDELDMNASEALEHDNDSMSLKKVAKIKPNEILLTTKAPELTIEQRLTSLSAISTDVESRVNTAKELAVDNAVEKPTSDSLIVLISQALQSNDEDLLEQCIGCESALIEPTAAALPTVRVVPFLLKLTGKLEKRPSRGHVLTIWLTNLLKHHASHLIGYQGLSKQLASLSQMLEQRLSTYTKLSSLGGRLDLVLHQSASIGNNMSRQPLRGGVIQSNNPLTTLHEEPSDNEDEHQDDDEVDD